MDDDLCFTPAVELARLLRSRELSARELLDAFLNRIHRVNPQLNAIVTLVEERAVAQATAADEAAARGGLLGVLHWLPIVVTIHPAVSVPAGFTTDGLPVGLQLVGRYGSDDRLLSVAGAVAEALLPEPVRPPGA